MFTGLIQCLGEVKANVEHNQARRLVVSMPETNLQTGESIAINGVCLTLLPNHGVECAFDVSAETLAVTNLGELVVGDKVNIERSMLPTTRFGGHYVSGHIDAQATLTSIKPIGDCLELTVDDFNIPAKSFLLPKGSIALNGVSLTINKVEDERVSLMLVPHTVAHTTFPYMSVGQRLNIEFDYLTRVIAHQLSSLLQLKREVNE
ncbi:riboflavin synthase alpha chain [Legionella birminghamensis]|uniref:Riboflavin synthase n=1 Tax=Legionella birminghamensis TaxID=28083 RepID=A0A378I9L5_9GAMM|nr:riboflavin synthase [Legionella birminghamensis]KTC75210.1 riboflavin synthase alpha chain [Legionella birminghamensis]STX31839.1 riboflavin synthase alpha chain [Legionella birminghamensis]